MRFRVHLPAAALMLISACGPGINRSDAAFGRSDELEYRVKAGFVFNFLKFVSWPPGTTTDEEAWRIGIIADRSVYEVMSETLAGKNITGHPVEVIAIEAGSDLARCHVVFVAESHTDAGAAQVATMERSAVLVVGETPDFARTHGIIGFVRRRDNLRLEINPARARNAGLIISGKLASIAELVEDKS